MGFTMGNPSAGINRDIRRMVRLGDLKSYTVPGGTAKRILEFAKPYSRLLVTFSVLIVIDALIGVASPLLYREIINSGILKKDKSVVVVVALIMVALALVDVVVTIVVRYFSSRIGEGFIYDMRVKVFSHIQDMPLAFFARTQTGALVSRLNIDIIGAQQAFENLLSSVIGNLLTIVATLVVMITLSWEITLISLIVLPLFVVPIKRFSKRLQSLTAEQYNLNAEMTNTMTERFNVSGAFLVKLFGQKKREITFFASRAARVRDIGVTIAVFGRLLFISLVFVSSLATALVYGIGGYEAIIGSLSVGTVVALVALLNRLYGPLMGLSNLNVDVTAALVSFSRVFEVLDLEPNLKEPAQPKKLGNPPYDLVFSHVNFTYPSAEDVSLASLESVAILDNRKNSQVLFDVSFVAKQKTLNALVGPSGAGKSTIAYLARRIYDPSSGSIELGGVNLRDLSFEDLGNAISIAAQDTHLFHDSLRNNLLYARPDASESELYEVLKEAQLEAFVQKLPEKLDTIVGDRGYRLSGGEKQRVAIARILLKAPQVVILDEATAHLDSESERKIKMALDSALSGRTSLVIAHRLSTVLEADQIMVVNEGRIVEVGNHETLLRQGGLYEHLYNVQFSGQPI